MPTSNKSRKAFGVAALTVLGLTVATCVASAGDQYFDRMDKISSGAGNAVAHNIAVQTINPWPRHAFNDRISIDGRRIALGFRRYQTGRTIPPASLATSAIRPIAGGIVGAAAGAQDAGSAAGDQSGINTGDAGRLDGK